MSDHDPKTVALYEAIVATQPDIKIKGKKSAYTSLNGHMFSFLAKEGDLALRLSKADREAWAEEHGTEPIVEHNTVMKEYVRVPRAWLEDTERVSDHLATSVAYIRSLKPKPTKRAPKKK